MCYCFQSFKELLAFFAIRFFRSGCKGKGLYYFNQIFLLFLEDFSLFSLARFTTRIFEELLLF